MGDYTVLRNEVKSLCVCVCVCVWGGGGGGGGRVEKDLSNTLTEDLVTISPTYSYTCWSDNCSLRKCLYP